MIRKKLVMGDFAYAAGVCESMVQEYAQLLKDNFPELRPKSREKFISEL